MTRRDLGKKEFVPMVEAPMRVLNGLPEMQKALLDKARSFRDANTFEISDYAEFKRRLDSEGGFYLAPWDGSKESEAQVKEET